MARGDPQKPDSEQGIRVFRNLDDALEWVLAKNNAVD